MDLITLFNITKQENVAIDQAIHLTTDNNSIDKQKVYYQETRVSYIKSIGTYLFYAYYFIVICVLYVLLFRQTGFSIPARFAIFIGFVVYPFLIGYLERSIINALMYCYAFINGNVYYHSSY